MSNVQHLLSIADLSAKEIWHLLLMAKRLKNKNKPSLKNKQMVMLFEKPSLRTKLSFDIAMNQLGGHAVYFSLQEVGLGKRESAADVSKVVSSMADLIVARVCRHSDLEELAKNSKVPVINALSDLEHPCQILADLLTIWESKDKTAGLVLAYVGDGENNIPHSLILGCALLGINFRCASPKRFWMNRQIVKKAKQLAKLTGAIMIETENPQEAVKDADIVYTDTWVSMGDECEKEKRLEKFKGFQVDQNLLLLAKEDAIFMHDLPAYRGREVTDEVIDGMQSVVFQQAENRLHAQKALLAWLISEKSNFGKISA